MRLKILRSTYNYFKHIALSAIHSVNEQPIIILGNQKSGTSVIAHLLADYGDLSKTIDIRELWWPRLEGLLSQKILLKDVIEKFKYRFSQDVIKEPNLTFFYPELFDRFPEAQFILIIRDPRDNIRSLLNRMSVKGDLNSLEDEDEDDIPEKWLPILSPGVWGFPEGNYIETLARRWQKAAGVYLQNQNNIHLIRYEDFTADKLGTIEKMAQNLGIEQKSDISDRVNIQYQPKGNRNISWEAFFGEQNLGIIEDICSSQMKRLNYETSENSG